MENYYDPQFMGTEQYYRHPIGAFLYTDSIKHFCEKKEAWWTLDLIGSYVPILKKYDFLVLTFDVTGNTAVFHAKEDTDQPDIVTQEIEYTDLPESVKLYWENGVALFPSDH